MRFKLPKRLFPSSTPRKDPSAFYAERLEKQQSPARAVGWVSEYTQRIRFISLSQIADLDGARICDAGSGLGDLYGYLTEEGLNVSYTGVDTCIEMVKAARERYPGVNFLHDDILTHQPEAAYDYVLASGLLSHETEAPERLLKETLGHLLEICTKGVGLNFLSGDAPRHMKNEDVFAYFAPERVFEIAKSFSPYLSIQHQYLPNDFTLFIYQPGVESEPIQL